jgi:hypothetical protein
VTYVVITVVSSGPLLLRGFDRGHSSRSRVFIKEHSRHAPPAGHGTVISMPLR